MRNIKYLFAFSHHPTSSLTPASGRKGDCYDIELSTGVVGNTSEMICQKCVERIKQLAEQKFYDNIIFHRVIDGFMAQTETQQLVWVVQFILIYGRNFRLNHFYVVRLYGKSTS